MAVILSDEKINELLNIFNQIASQRKDFNSLYFGSSIPQDKFQKAVTNFAPLKADELAILLADNTIFGSVKNGFLLTTENLYYKNPNPKAFDVTPTTVRKEDKIYADDRNVCIKIDDIIDLTISQSGKADKYSSCSVRKVNGTDGVISYAGNLHMLKSFIDCIKTGDTVVQVSANQPAQSGGVCKSCNAHNSHNSGTCDYCGALL